MRPSTRLRSGAPTRSELARRARGPGRQRPPRRPASRRTGSRPRAASDTAPASPPAPVVAHGSSLPPRSSPSHTATHPTVLVPLSTATSARPSSPNQDVIPESSPPSDSQFVPAISPSPPLLPTTIRRAHDYPHSSFLVTTWRAGSHAPQRAQNPVAAGAEAGRVYCFAKHLRIDLAQDLGAVIQPSFRPASCRLARAAQRRQGALHPARGSCARPRSPRSQ